MKIAIVWNYHSQLLHCSFRFEQYVRGLRALGHQPVVVCRRASAEGFDGPLEVAEDRAAFAEAGFWETVGAEVAIIVTWLRMPAVLAAIRAAGTRAVAIADTDGLIGMRLHPLITLERMIVYERGGRATLRCLKYWLTRYLKEATTGSDEEREMVASARNSDLLVLCSAEAQRHLARFLAHHGEAQLSDRLFAMPFVIAEPFLTSPVPATKECRITAIGRWSDPQKDPGLLVAALARVLAARPELEVVIFGAGGQDWFGPLAERFPSVSYRGEQHYGIVAETLGSCRAVVVSSRWESGPHVATEALAMGATIIGPAMIPGLVSWSEQRRFGHLAARSRPGSLARAIEREMEAWDQGRRDPRAIAEYWRPRLDPAYVCGQLLDALAGTLPQA